MIIDGPITFDLTVGADRRIPQEGDAQTVIPPLVHSVVLALRPTTTDNGGGLAITVSTLSDVTLAVNPSSAAGSTVIHLINPGLWELELTQAANFNYAMTPGVIGGCGIELLDAITGVRTAMIFRAAQIGSFVDFNRLRLLLIRQLSLRMFWTATAAAQNIDLRAMVNCIRIL